jgi:hypothetical protein
MTTSAHAPEDRLKEIAAKIAALEAMTHKDANTTQGEVENATALIQKLLTKYNLSLARVHKLAGSDPKRQTETQIEIQITPNHGERRFTWEEHLANAIARGFFCKVLLFKEGYYFIGVHNDAMTAIQTFNRLRPIIVLMSVRAVAHYSDEWTAKGVMDVRQLRGALSLKSYKLSYLTGVVSGIWRKLEEQRYDNATEATQVTALVLARDVAIDNAIAHKFPKIGQDRASTSKHNSDAFVKGREDGYNVNLHKGELQDGKGQ